MDPIFDGECHALSKKYGYVAKKLLGESAQKLDMDDIEELLLQYAEYLYENDKERVIEYLLSIFRTQVRHQSTDENYQVIYRPSWIISALSQFGTLCLKFERAEKDNLVEEDE
jgi:hypothetical protein